MLLTVAALFSFVAGSSLLALAFAGLGALARPDALLLGLLLLAVSLAQRRRRAAWGAAFFLGIVCIGWGARLASGMSGCRRCTWGRGTGCCCGPSPPA